MDQPSRGTVISIMMWNQRLASSRKTALRSLLYQLHDYPADIFDLGVATVVSRGGL